MPSLSKQGWKKYKAGHPCNQFLLDKFTALKRSADIQKLENQASCYRKIISSIDKYPLPIVCIQQALTLEGVGAKMASLIKTLIQHRYQAFLNDRQHNQFHEVALDDNQEPQSEESSGLPRMHSQPLPLEKELVRHEPCEDSLSVRSMTRAYKLRKESSAFYFMRLFDDNINIVFDKKVIKSLVSSKFGHTISHWAFISNLEVNGYVQKEGQGYKLHEKGVAALKQLNKSIKPRSIAYHNLTKVLAQRSLETFKPQKRQRTTLRKSELGAFRLVLIIDNREVRNSEYKDHFNQKLVDDCNVPCRFHNLALGDFLWIVESQHCGDLVLDHIVERKISSDLASSIVDGRYKEQRFRLSNCGIDNVFYIYEGKPSTGSMISETGLNKALRSIQFKSNFKVLRTTDINHTIRYLVSMHQFLQKMIEQAEELTAISTLGKFNSKNSKSNVPINCTLGLMLKCIPGVGRETVEFMVSKFKSARDMYLSLKELQADERVPFLKQLLHKKNKTADAVANMLVNILFP